MVAIGSNYWSALRVPLNQWPASGSRVNTLLNTAYVHGTSGAAVAIRYFARTTDPINEAYIFLDDIGGTLASITMGCAIYAEHPSTSSQPHATLLAATGTLTMPSAVDKWIKVVFSSPYTPTVGQILWIVFWNSSAAPATNYPIILNGTVLPAISAPTLYGIGFTTTTGWSTAGTVSSEIPFAVKQGSNVFGLPHTATNSTFYASATTMKGFQLIPPCDIEVCGWNVPTQGAAAYSGIRIYNASTAPGGSPLFTYNTGTDTNQSRDELAGAKIWAPVKLSAGVAYNVVNTYGTALAMAAAIVEDYASFPAIFDAMIDGFTACASVSDNAGTWLLNNSGQVGTQLVVSGFPVPAATTRRPKVWNGASWQEKPMGVWNGSLWEEQPLKTWNGSAWV